MPRKEIRAKFVSEGKCPQCGRVITDSRFKICYLCRAYLQRRKREFFAKNPKARKEQITKFCQIITKLRNETRAKIIQLLGSKCVKCGFSDIRALEIDHVRGYGTEERRKFSSPLAYYRFVLTKILKGSEDYQLLCANCNRIKTIENREHKINH